MTTTAERRRRVLEGLQARIDWCAQNDRNEDEIAKTAEILIQTAERYVREDALDAFYDELSRRTSSRG